MPHMRLIRRIFFLAVGLCNLVGAEAAPPPAPITRLADIRQMPREVAAKSHPVSVTGVVTWCSPARLSGEYASSILAAEIHFVGEFSVQAGKELGLGFLLTDNFDAQRVALRGLITGWPAIPLT